MNKEIALHNIAMCASKAFIDSNMPEYINAEDGYSMLVSDMPGKYIEAYKQAEKEFPKSKIEFGNVKPL